MVRETDGRKLDHNTLQAIRVRAVQQIENGAHPEEVAAALGMTRSAVYSWLAKYRQGGLGALAARPVPGRPPKLSGEQLRRLYRLVVGADPRQLAFPVALWTREMVRELIRREFGVALSAVSVGRLLRKLGLSPQRPLWRAYQQDPEAVARWKREEFPAVREEAQRAGATIDFADEAGVRSDYHAGTTWAPVGQTPVVRSTGARHPVNLVSAVTAQGKLRFAGYDGTFTSATFIDFCRRLLHDADRPVFLVVDGHPTHRSTAVKEFIAATAGRLRLFYLPGYSPQLNPTSGSGRTSRPTASAAPGSPDKDDLKAKALAARHRLQKLPHLIRGFFADPNRRYITA